MLVHRYQAQLNRFTTLSSPGSQDLPPGLPPYVNPHIEHSENMTQDIFYISAGQAGHLVLLIILAVVGGVSSVGLRDTECKPSPIFIIYGPTQNHLLLFNAGHIFVPPCRGKH